MAIQYALTFCLLAFEMALFAVISLPLPARFRRPLLQALSIPFHSQHFQIILKCILGFILIMFIDALNRMKKVTDELYNSKENANLGMNMGMGGVSRAEIQSRRFYSQRNSYLCGFCLFLTLVLYRTYSLVFELLAVKEKVSVLENEEKVSSAKAESKNNKINDDKIKQLKDQIADLEKEKETLKKKSKALSDEY